MAVYTKEMSHTGRTRPIALVSATNLALTLLFPTPKSRLPSLLRHTGRRVQAMAVCQRGWFSQFRLLKPKETSSDLGMGELSRTGLLGPLHVTFRVGMCFLLLGTG